MKLPRGKRIGPHEPAGRIQLRLLGMRRCADTAGFALGILWRWPCWVVVAYFRLAYGSRDQLVEVPSARGGSHGCSLWALLTLVMTCALDQLRSIVERLLCTHHSRVLAAPLRLVSLVLDCKAVLCDEAGLRAGCVSEREVHGWSAACWSPIRPVLKHGPRS